MHAQELDEAELEEARRRRQQYENDDSEMCALCLQPTPQLPCAPRIFVCLAMHVIHSWCISKLLLTGEGVAWVDRYDEFGRIKKKFRGSEADRKAREEAALARLRGTTGSGVSTDPGSCMFQGSDLSLDAFMNAVLPGDSGQDTVSGCYGNAGSHG